MWKATIQGKNFQNGKMTVDILFSSDTLNFVETIDMTGGSMDVLSLKVQHRIDGLNASDALHDAIQLGDFTPVIPIIEPTPSEILAQAIQHLEKVQKAKELGLLPDATVTPIVTVPVSQPASNDPLAEATAAAQAAFDPSLIDTAL